ncbi:MAG: hypothetical protein LC104_07390 [Bacteroidales bacterium]|nr:hypothetical protein [Bacteroidales bacterium]
MRYRTQSASSQHADTPNFELLRHSGWSVNMICGHYCVAFKGSQEVVLAWQNGEWKQVGGRGGTFAAAA